MIYSDIDYTPHWTWLNSLVRSDEEIKKIKINVEERKKKRLEALDFLNKIDKKSSPEEKYSQATMQTLQKLFNMGW